MQKPHLANVLGMIICLKKVSVQPSGPEDPRAFLALI